MDEIVTQGMTLLMEGNVEDAVCKLLIGYHRHCESLAVTQEDIDNSLHAHGREELSFRVPAISLQNAVDVEMEFVSNGNEFRLFDCGFVLEADAVSIRSPLGQVALSAVIMYNIGVIFHLLGAFPCEEEDLAKAFFMYSKATETLQRYQLQGTPLEELELAIYCNMGHVYSYMLDEKGMNSCRHEIRKRLNRLDASRIDPGNLQFFRDSIGLSTGLFDRAPAA